MLDHTKPTMIKFDDIQLLIKKDKSGRYLKCPFCDGLVVLNGPGSDQTLIGKISKKIAWTISGESQRLFTTPAADLHDFQGHVGLLDGEMNKIVSKQYRVNAYLAIKEKYKPLVSVLDNKLKNTSDGFFNWFLKLSYRKKKASLHRRWKELEIIAETHYTILSNMGSEYMVKIPCIAYKNIYGVTRS